MEVLIILVIVVVKLCIDARKRRRREFRQVDASQWARPLHEQL
jgi:hypothetical protein